MKIYGSGIPFTRDCRPRWLLAELDVPFEQVSIDIFSGKGQEPDYRALHPLGKVPVVCKDDLTMWESGATVAYLAETYGEGKLIPAPGTPERGRYHQWMYFAVTSVEPACGKMFVNRKFRAGQEGAEEGFQEGQSDLKKLMPALEPALEAGPFILGEQFTAADILLGTGLNWADMVDGLAEFPVLKKYRDRLAERPAFQKTFGGGES